MISQITIKGEVMSKKNSQMIVGRRRKMIIPSKQYRDYADNAIAQIKDLPPLEPEQWPVLLHFFFYRKTNRGFDYNNLSQGPQDLLVKAGIIPDDDMQHIVPVFEGEYAGWTKDADNPRLVLTFTECKALD